MKQKKKETSVTEKKLRNLDKLNAQMASDETWGELTCDRIALNLPPRDYTAEMVKEARRELGASQTIFANFLGVKASTVRAWEQGQNHVPGIACRFLDEIALNLEYWRNRLRTLVVEKEPVQE